ncbi:MAG: hypothetical protein JNN15_07375 [Blastocatellia bacterium]|nr:hypothetical protein [Blastocatellia bacterium]
MNFLKKLIGSTVEEVWKAVAQSRGGTYFPPAVLKSQLYPRMSVQMGAWPVVVDVAHIDKMTLTRFRSAFFNESGFAFNLYPKSPFSNLGIALGMQDIEVGHPDFGPHELMFGTDSYLDLEEARRKRSEFDEQYIIQGPNPEQVIRFFRNYRIRDRLHPVQFLRFEARASEILGDRLPPGVSKVHYLEIGILKDPERLGVLFELMLESLETLVEMGVTTRDDTGFLFP